MHDLNPWVLMWALAVGIYALLKWITYAYHPAIPRVRYGWIYLFAWPGMDPSPFHARVAPVFSRGLLMQGILNLGFGILLFIFARQLPSSYWYLEGWLACSAIVFVLHFGLFHLLAVGHRALGFGVQPIMRFPLGARTVSEFWGGRWNVAFTDLVQPFLYQPVRAKWGKVVAVFSTFAVSGLIHDLVISLPARGGWGLPTLYFLIQAAALAFERALSPRARGSIGFRIFTYGVIVLPAPMLFHPWFMKEVIVPFAGAI